MEIAQNKLTTSISKMTSNKKFLLECLIKTAVLSNKYWKLHQFSKKNFVFVHHNIICEKPSCYYIFLLLESNSRCKTSPLTTFLLLQFQRWSSKVLIKEKKGIHNSWKKYLIDLLIMFSLKIFISILLNCLFKISKIYITQKICS